MKFTSIEITNIRGFKHVPKTSLSESINIFVGQNNAGKSTILSCIYTIQRGILGPADITIGETTGQLNLFVEGDYLKAIPSGCDFIRFDIKHNSITAILIKIDGTSQGMKTISQLEPDNLIYPYLSKRKAVSYAATINSNNANSVLGNFTNLYSKIDRLITPQFQPYNEQYIKACQNVLGFVISTFPTIDGKQAVYFVHNSEYVPLTSMGEGVVNIVGLIADLCMAEDKIFIIEEPENDIHPKALKALLQLIIEKSSSNQFFISTHSNIVMKYLGSAPDSKVFHINSSKTDSARKNLYISTLKTVSNDPEERRQILEDLGYEFLDFDLWKGWLFLEESSAEIIIRDYLIDWFCKPLKSKLRTFSTCGITNLIPKFEDFDRLFIFLHLEPVYKNKVWVMIDGGEKEKVILQSMKDKYTKIGWNKSNFIQLNEHEFEKYYPLQFSEQIEEILGIKDKKEKREKKKALLNEVLDWIKANQETAKSEFKKSASEVIDRLKEINSQMTIES